jgi:hypothetical protein
VVNPPCHRQRTRHPLRGGRDGDLHASHPCPSPGARRRTDRRTRPVGATVDGVRTRRMEQTCDARMACHRWGRPTP